MSVRDTDLESGKRSWQSHAHQEDGTVPRSGLRHRHPSAKQGLRPQASPTEDPAVSWSHVHIAINCTLYLELYSKARGGCYVQQPLEVPVAHTSPRSVGSMTPTLSVRRLDGQRPLRQEQCPRPPPASCLLGGPGTCHFPTLPTLVTKATKTRALQAELSRHPVPAVPFCRLRPDAARPPDAIPTPVRYRPGIQVMLSSYTTAECYNVSSILFGHTRMGSPSKPVEKRKSHILFYYIPQST